MLEKLLNKFIDSISFGRLKKAVIPLIENKKFYRKMEEKNGVLAEKLVDVLLSASADEKVKLPDISADKSKQLYRLLYSKNIKKVLDLIIERKHNIQCKREIIIKRIIGGILIAVVISTIFILLGFLEHVILDSILLGISSALLAEMSYGGLTEVTGELIVDGLVEDETEQIKDALEKLEDFKKFFAKMHSYNYVSEKNLNQLKENGESMTEILFGSDAVKNLEHNEQRDETEQKLAEIVAEQEALKQKLDEIRTRIAEGIKEAANTTSTKIDRFPIPDYILFITGEDGVKRIDPRFLSDLRYIDLSTTFFDDVDVRGVDFTGCNPKLLDPQKVYQKDLSGTTFTSDFETISDFPFNINTKFNGVKLYGTKIEAKNDTFLELYGAELDENTKITVNGVELSNREPAVIQKTY